MWLRDKSLSFLKGDMIMSTIKLTFQEATLLKYLMKGSAFNSDQIDLTKSWEEQKLENGDA